MNSLSSYSRKLCIAPMLDWTDRHCRHFHRLLAPHAWLYTEMVTTGALVHGDVPRHLAFGEAEHPVALQLGGCDAGALAHSARLAKDYGYDEVNLNCGCPSERVQSGSFGACLMNEPALVRDGVRAMSDAVDLPITVKHRIGIDQVEHYGFVRDFIGTVAEGGAGTFIVHARNAWLKGLSPKENREIPPLRYDVAYQLKRDFPDLEIVLNGGIATTDAVLEHLKHLDGVMIGREAYHNPWMLVEWERVLFNPDWQPSREQILAQMVDYCADQLARGQTVRSVVRHMLGIANGLPGARAFRHMLSDSAFLRGAQPQLLWDAWQKVAEAAEKVAQSAP